MVSHRQSVTIGVRDTEGRVDSFFFDAAAFQIKHSTKRLSPWQFTYMPDNVAELAELQQHFRPVWVFLVCGLDGVVGLSLDELKSIMQGGETGAAWVRVSRSRNEMYRVSGAGGELPHAISRGVQRFLAALRTSMAET